MDKEHRIRDRLANGIGNDLEADDITIADGSQLVVDPYVRLSYPWHAFTPEWAQSVDMDEERRARFAAEPSSKVTSEIEPIESEQVKLTVIHDDLEPDGPLAGMVSRGWPARDRKPRRCWRRPSRSRTSGDSSTIRGI